jgi:hypothetical protein
VEGDQFDLEAPSGKYDVLSRTEWAEKPTGKTSYTFDIGLVLAGKNPKIAHK